MARIPDLIYTGGQSNWGDRAAYRRAERARAAQRSETNRRNAQAGVAKRRAQREQQAALERAEHERRVRRLIGWKP